MTVALERPACLYCHRSLPPNEAVPLFPYGRRIAFDQARNRFWVICTKCRKWNLAPLDEAERAAAVELFERWWRDSAARYSQGGIGLGKFSDELSVVRVGESDWNDFAGWRYADGLRTRRMWRVGKEMAVTVGALSLWGAGVIAGGTAFGTIAGMYGVPLLMRRPYLSGQRRVCRVPSGEGKRAMVRQGHLRNLELVAQQSGSWRLNVQHEQGVAQVEGGAAVALLSFALPRINFYGGNTAAIREGLALVREAGGPEGLFAYAAGKRWFGVKKDEFRLVAGLPAAVRMALEMAAQEQREREAMGGELARLREEWSEAQEAPLTS